MNKLLRDETRGRNWLRLYELANPCKLWSKGKTMYYGLHYCWLSETGGVQGGEWSYWTKAEGKRMVEAASVFDTVNLF